MRWDREREWSNGEIITIYRFTVSIILYNICSSSFLVWRSNYNHQSWHIVVCGSISSLSLSLFLTKWVTHSKGRIDRIWSIHESLMSVNVSWYSSVGDWTEPKHIYLVEIETLGVTVYIHAHTHRDSRRRKILRAKGKIKKAHLTWMNERNMFR